ncbi:hypothetical protein [Neolewinella antarctica]|uniref:Photosystem I assembly protein Ycf4 n=1 Tax=Neolewinella antarctica TaxID=442734 RepID=A0ABX0X7H1_9BACT|nr:hypothetical protein [Neolewinella antarctica]NJC25151.1 hypothetical protein [Neolewinella antarctica]
MKFRHRKFRILVTSFVTVAFLMAIIVFQHGSFAVNFRLFWFGIILLPLYVALRYGAGIFERYVVDASGLTIRRPFRKALRIDFTEIKTLRLLKENMEGAPLRGKFEIRYRPDRIHAIELDYLKMPHEFMSRINAGFRDR